jgi:hypothetical protein
MLLDPRGTSLAAIDKVHAAFRSRSVTAGTAIIACGSGALVDAVRIAAGLSDGGLPIVVVATTLGAAIDRGVDPVARRGGAALAVPVERLMVDYDAMPRGAKDGLGVLVRDAMVEGDDFFDGMEVLAPHPLVKWPWESVIDDALRVDRMHAGDDRRVLELGGPLADAIARVHAIPPQRALALALRATCLAAKRVTKFGERDHLRVLAVLALLGFDLHDARIDVDAVLAAIPPGTRLALPHKIGDVEAGMTVTRTTLRGAIARLVRPPGAAEFR